MPPSLLKKRRLSLRPHALVASLRPHALVASSSYTAASGAPAALEKAAFDDVTTGRGGQQVLGELTLLALLAVLVVQILTQSMLGELVPQHPSSLRPHTLIAEGLIPYTSSLRPQTPQHLCIVDGGVASVTKPVQKYKYFSYNSTNSDAEHASNTAAPWHCG